MPKKKVYLTVDGSLFVTDEQGFDRILLAVSANEVTDQSKFNSVMNEALMDHASVVGQTVDLPTSHQQAKTTLLERIARGRFTLMRK